MESKSEKEAGAVQRDRGRRRKIEKRPLHGFPRNFWSASTQAEGKTVAPVLANDAVTPTEKETLPEISELSISHRDSCNTCNIPIASHLDLREHFQSDHHKLNLKRKLKNKPPVSEENLENSDFCLSDSSVSGSEADSSDSDDEPSAKGTSRGASKASVKLQFKDPSVEDGQGYIVVYKAAIPDLTSLQSFANLGSWAVILSGSGHFSACIWDSDGKWLVRKSFHRYTTRRKQGGSQAVADAGGGIRIKSAGAHLRRYGERALRQEVRQLLTSWEKELQNVQCVFLRCGKRDKKDLLFWEGSPLMPAKEKGLCRTIPFTTKRAIQKEVIRVYELLSTAVVSPISLIEEKEEEPVQAPKAPKPASVQSKPSSRSQAPVEKGTSHLKKRPAKKAKEEAHDGADPESEAELNPDYVELISDVAANKLAEVQLMVGMNPEVRTIEFGTEYFQGHDKLKTLTHGYGLVGISAACVSLEVLEWLMLEKVPLTIGGSPYMVTKAKSVRTFLRTFWGKHPDLHNYAEAEIPGPLSEADKKATADKERTKRRREREKKKEKAFLEAEAAKPAAVRARELRAAAAEMRLLGNKCIVCKKSLEGVVPFERLSYKYCSMDHCQKHREVLGKH